MMNRLDAKESFFLVCKKVSYLSSYDEDAFFEWIKKIKCIDHISGAGNELYLYLKKDKAICEYELRELLALFYRYKIDMKQFSNFMDEKNKSWFYDNKRAFWHKRVFGAKE